MGLLSGAVAEQHTVSDVVVVVVSAGDLNLARVLVCVCPVRANIAKCRRVSHTGRLAGNVAAAAAGQQLVAKNMATLMREALVQVRWSSSERASEREGCGKSQLCSIQAAAFFSLAPLSMASSHNSGETTWPGEVVAISELITQSICHRPSNRETGKQKGSPLSQPTNGS